MPSTTIPAAILDLLPEDAKLAVVSAQVGPTDAEKTAYCAKCRRHTGPQTPLCDRCTMLGLLAAIALLGEKLIGAEGDNGISAPAGEQPDAPETPTAFPPGVTGDDPAPTTGETTETTETTSQTEPQQ